MKLINKVNEQIAIHITFCFGTMWCAYAFFLYGFGPVLWPEIMDKMLYWSNTVQLWSLPVIMVGQNLQGRTAEKRSQQMFKMIKEELALLKKEKGD